MGAILAVAALVLSACVNGPGAKGPPGLDPTGATSFHAAPIKGDQARFAFAPVDGAPTNVLRQLSVAMNREVTKHKLNVVTDGDPSATYVVHGYLSAVGDGSGTTLVYVWDVLDGRGMRLYRITGQEPGRPASSDPWTGIQPQMLADVAKRTFDALSTWVTAG